MSSGHSRRCGMNESPADQLRRLRRARGLSQLAVATAAGTPQRHLSFIESGRARPGPDLLTRLAAALRLSMVERNALFEAAGLLPPAPIGPLQQDRYAVLRQAAWRLIEQQQPYPALLLDAGYEILAVNPALSRLLALLELPERLWPGSGGPANLLRLSFDAEGLVRHMDDPMAWVPAYWRQIRRDAVCGSLLREIETWPHVQAWLRQPPPAVPADPLLLERYRFDGRSVALLSMMTTPGVPTDITAASLRVNLLFPADAATDDWLRRLDG